jgi:hypothetical protein
MVSAGTAAAGARNGATRWRSQWERADDRRRVTVLGDALDGDRGPLAKRLVGIAKRDRDQQAKASRRPRAPARRRGAVRPAHRRDVQARLHSAQWRGSPGSMRSPPGTYCSPSHQLDVTRGTPVQGGGGMESPASSRVIPIGSFRPRAAMVNPPPEKKTGGWPDSRVLRVEKWPEVLLEATRPGTNKGMRPALGSRRSRSASAKPSSPPRSRMIGLEDSKGPGRGCGAAREDIV